MRPNKPPADKCPQDKERVEAGKDKRESCPLNCKYNHFESEDLTIDAWELKCLECGWRDTIGFRSDETDDDEEVDPLTCPFCNRDGMSPGKNPCKDCE